MVTIDKSSIWNLSELAEGFGHCEERGAEDVAAIDFVMRHDYDAVLGVADNSEEEAIAFDMGELFRVV